MRQKGKKRNGFTIAELAVGMSVIIVLATTVVVGLSNCLNLGKRASVEAALTMVSTAVNRYHYLHKALPQSLNDLTKQDAGEKGPLLEKDDLQDKWQNSYHYAIIETNTMSGYAIWSRGVNKKNDSGSAPQKFTGDDIGVFLRM